MRIVIVTSEYNNASGGLSYGCCQYSSMLHDLGHDVVIINSANRDLFSLENPKIYQDDVVMQEKFVVLPGGYNIDLWKHLFFRAHLKNSLASLTKCPPDLIVAFSSGYNGLFASEIAESLNKPLIVMLRGSEINLSLSDLQLRMANFRCLSNAWQVISLSQEMLQIAKGIHLNSCTVYEVIPNPVKGLSVFSIWNKSHRTVHLGCGAHHLNEKKGIANLIVMMSYLKVSSDLDFDLQLCGSIDPDLLSNYRDLCTEYGVSDLITFCGELTRDEFIDRMMKWDVYVQGSICEGFSNSVGEYMSLGKSFVLSNSGYFAELIRGSHPALVFPDLDPKNMANHLTSTCQMDDLESIYSSAYKIIYEHTSIDVVIKQWGKVLDRSFRRLSQIKKVDSGIFSVVLHDIGGDEHSGIDMPIEAFRSFVEVVSTKGYRLCSSRNYFACSNRQSLIACTFDDAYSGVLDHAFPILRQYGFTATVFVCSDHIGRENDWNPRDNKNRRHLNEYELKVLLDNGWEIGSHGMSHTSLLRLSYEKLVYELSMSKKKLMKIFGTVEAYAYPFGFHNPFCEQEAANVYKYAYALTSGGSIDGIDNHQIRRYTVSEILKVL